MMHDALVGEILSEVLREACGAPGCTWQSLLDAPGPRYRCSSCAKVFSKDELTRLAGDLLMKRPALLRKVLLSMPPDTLDRLAAEVGVPSRATRH